MKKGILLIFLISFLYNLSFATTNHTITIDGTNDFATDEDFTGTSGAIWYFTWDANNFYFAVSASDVNNNDANKWVHLYIDTDPKATPTSGTGSTTGVTYNTQTPTLPISANYHFRWKTDNSYTNLLDYNTGTSSWDDDNTGGNNFGIAAFQSGTFVEFSIPRASLGNPVALQVSGTMVNEAGGSEWTYFMFPSSGNTDGYQANHSSFYGFVLNDGLSPDDATNLNNLPVELTKFNATPQNNSIQLDWQTATEQNNSHFEIQKSIDGKEFSQIGTIEGFGTTTDVQNYTFIDENPINGQNYYRLKQVDFNGDFEYSEVAVAEFSKRHTASFYPNPMKDELVIDSDITTEVNIQVFNLQGQLVKQFTDIQLNDKHQINLSDLNSGVYQLQLIDANSLEVLQQHRLIKQ